MNEAPNNVILFPEQPRVQRINGCRLPLGSMSVDELLVAAAHAEARAAKALSELYTIQEYLGAWFPDGDMA